MTAPQLVLRGSFSQAQERQYSHVPFDVPRGMRAMHVAYDYSNRVASDPRLRGGNTLDIGLFDPFDFRGWSGSHKLDFSLSETWASPAYRAGPIHAGRWRVLLGPYKVDPRGCDYEVAITFSEDPGQPPDTGPRAVTALPPDLRAAAEPGWLRGDLHCHTVYSDGDAWPADILAEAVLRGLDFLGVTDHNQTAHQAAYASVTGEHLPIILPGIEVTTYGGHWNAWGTDRWWEFREPTTAATSRAMQAAAASGALVSVNHPKPFGPAWEYRDAVGYHAIEVWNGDWQQMNHVALSWWEEQLRGGRRVVALGGSDTHHLKQVDADVRHGRHLGQPTTWAQAGEDRSPEGVLTALRAGHAFISRDVDGPQLYFSRADGGLRVHAVDARRAALMLLSARGIETTTTVHSSDWSAMFHLDDPPLYVRAQLMDEHGQMLALSNALCM